MKFRDLEFGLATYGFVLNKAEKGFTVNPRDKEFPVWELRDLQDVQTFYLGIECGSCYAIKD